jgi:hypothetical protein
MRTKKVSKIRSLLAELEIQNIPYVSWKNNHQLGSVLLGIGDIDLFVPSGNRSKFIDLCRSQGWIETINSVSRHPWVSHFYRLGDNYECFHVHVYFKLITGETWIKEYSIPFDSWMIESRVWSVNHDVWVLNDSSQAYLFLVRHLLKCGSFSSRLLYKREIDSYREEWKVCRDKLGADDIVGPTDLSPYLKDSRAFSDNLDLPSIRSAVLFRWSFLPFLRYKLHSLPLRRVQSFLLRLKNKVFLKQKKLLPGGGLTIAISGVDGSGKTTMLQEVEKVLAQFLTVERFHLGRPQGQLIEFVWRFLGNKSENSTMPGCFDINTPSSRGRAMNGAILALLRLRKARFIINRASRGGLMLTDRWPTDEVGKMDGPRVILGENSGWIQHLCKRIESWAYASMPRADICYFFVVPIDVAIERNRSRIKENKETDEQISARFHGNIDYKPLASKTIRFENSGDFSLKRKELFDNVWHEIVSRY